MRIADSLDTKIGIMLGFAIVVLAQIALVGGITDLGFPNKVAWYVFYVGFLLIAISAAIGTHSYFLRRYIIGSEISELLDHYEKNEPMNYRYSISGNTYKGLIRAREIGERKAFSLKIMFIYFSMGIVLLILSGYA
jgi:hypothetical protein